MKNPYPEKVKNRNPYGQNFGVYLSMLSGFSIFFLSLHLQSYSPLFSSLIKHAHTGWIAL